MPSELDTLRKQVARPQAEYILARRQVKEESDTLLVARRKIGTLEQAQGLVQQVAQQVQQQAHHKLAAIVSRCLQAVFDEPYEFQIQFDRKRGRTEARLLFVREGDEVDPMTASGGGVVDVAAFALRLACILLSRPPMDRVIILDEPFKFLSAEYRPRVATLLVTLAREMKVQFILVTHFEELKVGRVVDL